VKVLVLMIAVCAALALTSCGGDSSTAEAPTPPANQVAEDATGRTEPTPIPPKGPIPRKLVVKDLIDGSGRPARDGDELAIEYVGKRANGAPFSSSWQREAPFHFQLGGGRLNFGLERGLKGMRVGARRKLIIPADLIHGRGGTPPGEYRKESLVYVVDLVGIG